MSSIVPVDFGKEARESARAFARLLKLVEDSEAEVLAHPAKYFDMASKRLAEAERFASELYNALHVPWMAQMLSPQGDAPPELKAIDAVTIDRRDYEALQALKKLINARGP